MRAGLRALAVVVLGATVVACSPPPSPSEATEALEPALLTADQVGAGFEETFRGGVGVSGGTICPESDFRTDDIGMMRAAFARGVDGGREVLIEQMMYVVQDGEANTAIANLQAAYEACDGRVWTDYGEDKTVLAMTAPRIGDTSFAVAFPPPDYPEEGTYDYGRTVYVASGSVLMEISCWETLEGESAVPITTDDEFYRVAAEAAANLRG